MFCLVTSTQPNIVMDSDVRTSLHSKCHHQIIYSKLISKIEYPPPFARKFGIITAESDLIALLKTVIYEVYSKGKPCSNKNRDF